MSALKNSQLRVMSFNIRYDCPKDGIHIWANRADSVCNLIKEANPDLIGLQECLQNQMLHISKALPEYEHFGAGRDDGLKKGEMGPIFYRKDRFTLKNKGVFWLSSTPEKAGTKFPGSGCNRIVTWAELSPTFGDSKKHIFFYNTHFDHQKDEAREFASKLLLEKIQEIGKGSPAIVTGDLNADYKSTPYTILTSTSNTKPLVDASSVLDGASAQPTFIGFTKTYKSTIDFIMVQELKPVSREVITKTRKGDKGEELPISDHFAIQAVVEI